MMCVREYRLSNFRYGRAIKHILAMHSLEVQGHRLTLEGILWHLYFQKKGKTWYLNFLFHSKRGNINPGMSEKY